MMRKKITAATITVLFIVVIVATVNAAPTILVDNGNIQSSPLIYGQFGVLQITIHSIGKVQVGQREMPLSATLIH